MAKYSYQARTPSGALQSGQLEAPDQASAAQILLNRSLTPVSIEPLVTAQVRSDWRDWLQPKVSIEELSLFARQMYSLTRSGIPILRAIAGLAESTTSQRLAATLKEVNEQLERGRNLSSAMHQHPDVFPPLFVSVVHVGENTGKLDEAFRLLSQYLEREQETRRQIKAATRYPLFVVVAIVIALVIINLYVIPAFSGMFARLGAELPPVTRFLIAMSDLFVYQWHWLLAGVLGLVWGVRQYLRTEGGRLAWDRRKLRLYPVGSIFERALLARFARSFSMMITAGVPLTHALNLVADAVDNRYVGKRILEMRRNIEKGESLTRVCVGSGLFTPLVLQMINVGEETGRVDELLGDVADFYEREVEYDLRSLTAKIEPLLIALVSVMVAVLALGIFTPMWGLMSAYRGGG